MNQTGGRSTGSQRAAAWKRARQFIGDSACAGGVGFVVGSFFTALKNHYVSFARKASIAYRGKTGASGKHSSLLCECTILHRELRGGCDSGRAVFFQTNPTMSQKKGICYLAGAGPGDPGLLTIRARECIGRADVIVYDYLCNPEILKFAPAQAELIYAGKKSGEHTFLQDEINALLVEKTKSGKCVVRLKGGDPFLFGRGGEEAEALAAAKLDFEIVPGVTSAIAAPAYAGIPVTHRGHTSQLTIFTGHEDPSKAGNPLDYKAIAAQAGTRVMLMGVERAEEISSALMKNGADPETPVAFIQWATTGRQRTITGCLRDIAEVVKKTNFQAPAVAVIGEVVKMREKLKWFETRPLYGRRIVVTRTRKQAGGLAASLLELGADVLELPTIRIEPPKNLLEFGQLVQDAHSYDWIVFTSANGVDAFFEMFYKIYSDAREIGGVRIAAIGQTTARRVKDFHLKVDLQPEDFVAEEIVREFKKQGSIENEKILLATAEVTRDVLAEALTKMGAIVDVAIAYRTVPETEDAGGGMARFRDEGADLITFTSSSSVRNFMALKLPLPDGLKAASIGPMTSKTMREMGLSVDAEAKQHDVPGLIRAIRTLYAGRG
jgi:uroporphyrinogen III methyltransferase/synthase